MAKPKNHARIVKTWRKKNLLSQASLASALGITTRCVQYLESGQHLPSYDTQARFNALVERYKKARTVSEHPII